MTDPNAPSSPTGDAEATPATRGRGPSAASLLILAAIFPGLPHLLRGRRGWAALLALPVVLPVLAVILLALATSGTSLAARLLDPAVLTALIGVQVLLLLWRLFAIGAVRVLAPFHGRATTIAALAVAVAVVVGPQAVAVNLTVDARDAAAEVFQPSDEGGAWVPDASAPPVASNDPDFGAGSAAPSLDATASPSASPSPSPAAAVPRINVLLIGVDAGVGRNTFLTDSMIVASLDPVAGTVSMASVPRDMVDVPLPDGRTFKPKINSLVSYVNWHMSSFPGATDGESVLASAIGTLLGMKIDLWAEVNLGGFAYLVDSVGGINIKVTSAFCDYRYKEYGIDGFADLARLVAHERRPGPRVRTGAQGRGRERLHARRAPAGGHRRHPRPHRPRRLPRQPGQVPRVGRADRAHQHQAVVHRGLDRRGQPSRPRRRLPNRHRASPGEGRLRRARAPSSCPT